MKNTLKLFSFMALIGMLLACLACGGGAGEPPDETEDPPWTWGTYSDSGDGTGNSTITMTETSGTLTFTGELRSGDPNPYAGFQAYPNDAMKEFLKIAVSIRFDFYGDGKTYNFKLPTTDITDYCYYAKEFTPTANTWQTITINVADLEQPDSGVQKALNQDLVQWIEWQTTGMAETTVTSGATGTTGQFNVSIKNLTLIQESGSGTQDDPFLLYPDTWTNGSITPATIDEAVWYTFFAVKGATYHIWWNDDDNTSGLMDIRITAYDSDEGEIFDVDNIYTNYEYMNYQSFTASSSGTVKIKVYPYWPDDSGYPRTGTFALVYSAGSTRPAGGSVRIGTNLNIKQITDGAPEINATINLSKTGSHKTHPVTVSNPSDYNSITWEVPGVGAYEGQSITGSGASFILDAENIKYNSLGGHALILTVVTKDGQQYQKAIPFTITN